MNPDLLTMALITGAFTYAFRFLPTKLNLHNLNPKGLMSRFLAATGPAAIATLVAASLWPMIATDSAQVLPLLAGVATVVAVFLWQKSAVLSTIVGAVAYGAVFALVSV